MRYLYILLFITLFNSCTVSQSAVRGDRTSVLRKTMQNDAERFIIQNLLKLEKRNFDLLTLDQESSINEGDGNYLNQRTLYKYKSQEGIVLTSYNKVYEFEGGFDNLLFRSNEAIEIEEFLRKFKADLNGYEERYLTNYSDDLSIEIKKKYGKLIYVFWRDNNYRHEINSNDWKDLIEAEKELRGIKKLVLKKA